MLWWDDDVKKNQVKPPDIDNEEMEACFRNTGVVPVPRKVSKSYNPPPRRKMSAPTTPTTPPVAPGRPTLDRKLSCPAPSPVRQSSTSTARNTNNKSALAAAAPSPTLPRLKMGVQSILEEVDFDNEELAALKSSKEGAAKSRLVVHPKEEARVRVQVDVVKVREGKESVATREPDLKKELKRGSMKEKWGLTLVHRTGEGNRIELGVSKVAMFSPAAKAGILPGNTLILINDWKVEAMEQADSALSILLAAGFSVQLAWITSKDPLDPGSWQPLHTL